MMRRIEEALRRHISPWGLALLVLGLLMLVPITQMVTFSPTAPISMNLACLGSFVVAIGIAVMLQFRRERLDHEAEARGQIERGDRVFHVLIQVPQEIGREDKLRSALDLQTSEVHRGIEPLVEACSQVEHDAGARADVFERVRIEVRELADIDQDLEVYASDVMRKALHPFGEEKQTYRETSEAKREGYMTLVTWLLLVRLPTTPRSAPLGHAWLGGWLDALIPPHPEDTLSSQVACSIPLHDLDLADLATQQKWRDNRS